MGIKGQVKTISGSRFKSRFGDYFRDRELSTFSFPAKSAVIILRTIHRAIEEFFSDECFQRASALAFATLIALVPVTAVSFFFLTKLNAFNDIEVKIEDFVFQNFVPTRTEEIRSYIVQYTNNVGVLGAFGTMALIVVAIFLFNNIEVTFNNIWHVKKKRPLFGKLTSLWTVLTLTPFLFGVSFLLAAKFTAQSEGIIPAWVVPYLLNTLAFWVAYQFIPYTNVRLHAAIIAAVVVAILWEIAKAGFNMYITNLTSFSQIYGSLGTVPVFLLWLYLTWLIILFGTELAYAIQYPHKAKTFGNDYREFYAVRAMAEIARIFSRQGNRPNTIDGLRNAGVPPDIIGDILNLLAKENLLILTEENEYYPARAPSAISIHEIIDAVSGSKLLAPPAEKDPLSQRLKKKFEEAGEQIAATLDGVNLQDLISSDDRQERFHPEVDVK